MKSNEINGETYVIIFGFEIDRLFKEIRRRIQNFVFTYLSITE